MRSGLTGLHQTANPAVRLSFLPALGGGNMASNDDIGLCIPYTIRVTPDKGRGVFADSAIRKGTTVWRHMPGQYVEYDERSLKELLDSHFVLIAARDLDVGDELTLDYNSNPEDPLYCDTLCDQYGVSWEWL